MEKDRFFQMRVDDAFLKMLDDWRRHQPDLPTRAGAVRRLVDRGLVQDRADLWANCAEALYMIIVAAHRGGSISDEVMEEANKAFGGAFGEGMAEHQIAREKYGITQPGIAPGFEESIVKLVRECSDIDKLETIWRDNIHRVVETGYQNRSFQQRIIGLFAERKAEILGIDDLFSVLPEFTDDLFATRLPISNDEGAVSKQPRQIRGPTKPKK